MPRFENHESLEKFLNNMRLEIFNNEFNSFCNISPDLLNPFFEERIKKPDENPKGKKVKSSGPTIVDKKSILAGKLTEPLLGKRQNSNDLFDNEIPVQAEFKKKKPDQLIGSPHQTIQSPSEDKFGQSNEQLNHSPMKSSVETQADFAGSQEEEIKCQQVSMWTQADGELPESKAQELQTVVEQAMGKPGKTIFIQPIYIFHSDQQVGYFEVDVMDENSLKQISMFLQQYPQPQLPMIQQNQSLPPFIPLQQHQLPPFLQQQQQYQQHYQQQATFAQQQQQQTQEPPK